VLAADGGLYDASRGLERPIAAVSTTLHRLEFLGGERLFHISENRLILTEAGQTFFAQTEPLLEKLYTAYQNVASGRIILVNGMEMTGSPWGTSASRTKDKPDSKESTKPWWRIW
jgi:DNA-binding transcriptional LysR family regulator